MIPYMQNKNLYSLLQNRNFIIYNFEYCYSRVNWQSVRKMDAGNTTDTYNIDFYKNEEDQALTNLGIMAAKIAIYNFAWRYIALVVFLSDQNSEAVDAFLSRYNKSVVVKLGKFRPRYQAVVPQYTLFGEENSEIIEYLNWLMEMKFDNTGKYLLICYSKDYQKCDEKQIFKEIKKLHIVNVIFLRITEHDIEPIFFTFRPILPGICKNNEPERLNISNSNCFNDSCFKFLYPEKLKNLQKCPLIVSTFEQPPFMYLHNGTSEPTGGDADMLKIVSSQLNATLVIKTPPDGNEWGHFVDHNWTGSLGDVFNNRAHLSVCSLPLTSNKYGNFQISFIYNTMDIVWVAQLPAVKPSWEKLLRPFNFHTRVAVFITFICVIIVTGLTRTFAWRRATKFLNTDYPRQSLLFYSWVIFLGVPILKLPTKRGFLVVVYIWVWFCFVIRSGYQAALIGSLKKLVYYNNFENFKDFSQQKYQYGGQASYREFFLGEHKIYDNWKQLRFMEALETLRKISNGSSSFVLAFNKEMVIEHLMNHTGTRRLQMIPEKIVNSPTVMYLRKYSPLAAPLSTALSRAVEAGYAAAWHMRFARQKKHLFQHAQKRSSEALTLEHFGGCIVLIIAGWTVSILFFIIEVYCGRIEKSNDIVQFSG